MSKIYNLKREVENPRLTGGIGSAPGAGPGGGVRGLTGSESRR